MTAVTIVNVSYLLSNKAKRHAACDHLIITPFHRKYENVINSKAGRCGDASKNKCGECPLSIIVRLLHVGIKRRYFRERIYQLQEIFDSSPTINLVSILNFFFKEKKNGNQQ